jgi:DNA-directed RNA polymerase specialized sigma subunit
LRSGDADKVREVIPLPTSAEKKAWLWNYSDCLEKEKEISQRIEEIRNELTGLKAIGYDGMPHGSGDSHDLSDGIVKLMEEEKKLLALRERTEKTWRQIQRAISSPSLTSQQTQLLHLRYIRRMWWDDIAEEMGVSQRTVHRIHGKALQRIELPKGRE